MITMPYEVMEKAPGTRQYPTDKFCEIIPQVEEELANECLGAELMNFIASKCNNCGEAYTGQIYEWVPGKTYNADDKVIRNGCVYTTGLDSVTADPLALMNPNPWNLVPKFNHSGVTELWEKYLWHLISLKVFMSSLIYTTFNAGATGLMVDGGSRDGTGLRSANKSEMSDYKTALKFEIDRVAKNMNRWLNDNWKEKELPQPLQCSDCDIPQKRSRRFAFRT